MKKRIYIYKNGQLQRQDNSLVLICNDEKDYIPVMQIECIFVYSHLTLNKEVLQLLSMYNISILFFDYHGNYIGSYYSKEKRIGSYLINQVKFYLDNEKRFVISKEIIISSIDNMLALLKYYNKKGINLLNEIESIDYINDRLNELTIDYLHQLTILEAQVKLIYYSCFSVIVKNEDFVFKERSVRPPKDAINALMSFGYTLLYSLLENIIYKSNLDISIPFIHGTTRKPTGLQYDIADIFKPVLIDRLIFRLINKQQINISHFEKKNSGVYLNKVGTSIFITEFENTLLKVIKLNENKSYSYRSILSKEIYSLSNAIMNNKQYKAFRMRW